MSKLEKIEIPDEVYEEDSVKEKRYFERENKYGAFVRPLRVTVGDFPDYGLDEM